jgi:hypothetical protein
MKANLFISCCLISFAAFGIFLIACEKSPVKPTPEPPKDPRQYSWTVDTLSYPGSFQTVLNRIWGSSPQNVYVVGHCDDIRGQMYHFDGKAWHPISFTYWGPIDLTNIYGFSENDIWIVGSQYHQTGRDSLGYPIYYWSSLIIHYNGSTWQKPLDEGGQSLISVWGISPTDIWASGINTLLHYDGAKWAHVPIFMPSQGVQFTSISGLSSNDVYMTGYRNDVISPIDSTFYYLYHYDGLAWSIIDSACITIGASNIKFGELLKTIDGQLYSEKHALFILDGGSWTKLFEDPYVISFGGNRRDNIFCIGGYGTVFHYNGTDWQRIVIAPNFQEHLYDVWTDARETFMITHDGYQTYIIHGK